MRLMSILCLSLLMACSPHAVKVSLTADPVLNLDAHRHPLPVVVRVYQVSDPRLFQSAHFSALWKDDVTALGRDMLARQEVLLLPGQSQAINLNLHQNTTHIAVLALFRETRQAKWRVVQAVKPSWFTRRMYLSVKDKTLQIQS